MGVEGCCRSDDDEDARGLCDVFPCGVFDPDFPGCWECEWFAENFVGYQDVEL